LFVGLPHTATKFRSQYSFGFPTGYAAATAEPNIFAQAAVRQSLAQVSNADLA
jgi:hypothetical protein